jgi:hypothetical protein
VTPPVRLDASARTVVAVCTSCAPWRVLRASRPAALRAAATHLEAVHADHAKAADLREQAARIDRRHAD